MKFIIRDDDLNYFSTPADIERWYATIFAQKIPVGFAAVPFVKPSSDVYPFWPRETARAAEEHEYAISKNIELAEYVKNNPLIEVIQHGCTHETAEGVFEYAKHTDLIEDTRRGKAELERAFGKLVHVFAPPHDWIGTEGIRGIEAAHLHVIRGRGAGLRNWLWRWQYAWIFMKMLLYRFPRYISSVPPVYPYVLNFGSHKELCSYRLEDPDIFKGLEYVLKKGGIFVVVAHVHGLSDEKVQKLKKLIDKGRASGATFVRPSEVFGL
ncbi:MAG: hypothetical protein P4M11_00835 [Candidatus Pacebacteria bacterium]|nr:hypothetical protein [Candidatus Paceibacterota bacterium]